MTFNEYTDGGAFMDICGIEYRFVITQFGKHECRKSDGRRDVHIWHGYWKVYCETFITKQIFYECSVYKQVIPIIVIKAMTGSLLKRTPRFQIKHILPVSI